MKSFFKKSVAWIILIAAIVSVMPTLANRISSEAGNNNVIISLYYQNLASTASKTKIDETLDKYLAMGIDRIMVKEDDLNYLVSKGDVTCIKYNVLRHKYDDESMGIAEEIEKTCPNVSDDSYVLMVKRPEFRERIAKAIPMYYTDKDCCVIRDIASMDIYVFYDGRRDLWEIPMGYDEDLIKSLHDRGFEISLMHKVNGFGSVEYLSIIDELVKKYNIKYLNIQEAAKPFSDANIEKCYMGIADIINSNNLTLVVTENVDQLSNQHTLGYQEIFDAVMSENGSRKVLRSYETYDSSQDDGSHYLFRTQQFFNSTVDRNIRFINITQIYIDGESYEKCIDYTFEATKLYKEKIMAEGFSVNGDVVPYDYKTDNVLPSAFGAVIMVMCVLLMFEMVFGKRNTKLTVAAIILALVSFAVTFKMPASLLALYPTLYSVVMSCFALTLTLCLIKKLKDKFNALILIAGAILTMLIAVFVTSFGMGAMLSGIDYYMNNLIFRGIKLSLLVPVAYTAIAYYLMFIKTDKTDVLKDIRSVLMADIKVYWVIIGGVIGIIGLYYIIRSGNVTEISGLEAALRNTMTELFPARPRTKEFLIGYPALVLFVYYTKHVDIKLIKWLLAVASSILAASVTNSFCHVFTDYSFICMRVINGLLVGLAVSVAAYIGNLIIVKIIKKFKANFLS